jgi:hypothetical protein
LFHLDQKLSWLLLVIGTPNPPHAGLGIEEELAPMPKKPKTKKPGVVRKIVKYPGEPEKVEISVGGADDLYREVRIENRLEKDGEKVKLKDGAPVKVIVEAEQKVTTPKD